LTQHAYCSTAFSLLVIVQGVSVMNIQYYKALQDMTAKHSTQR